MPDTGAPWNIPYVAGTDLVADWPTDSQTLATAIANGLDAAVSIISVHQATKTDTQSITGSTPVTLTDLSITMTPASATNKVLLLAAPTLMPPNANLTSCALFRDGTILLQADAAGNRTRTLTGQMGLTDRAQVMTMIYLDSPATTSSVTYDVRAASTSGGTTYINRTQTDTDNVVWPRFASTLLAVEVAV